MSQWTDKSNNAYTAAQATAANQPLWLDNGLNNTDVIDFTGFRFFTLGSDYIYSTNDGLSAFSTISPDASIGVNNFWFDFGNVAGNGYGFRLSSSHLGVYTPGVVGGSNLNPAHAFGAQPLIHSNIITFNNNKISALNGITLLTQPIIGVNQLTAAEINESIIADGTNGPVTIGGQSKTFSQTTRHVEGTIARIWFYPIQSRQ